ncbi:site-specific integrase [Salinicola endophyticus]|uniref:site-specific integrase n=1 Tax=Salinicola endophyticus TaxID=1949083 RepID=UPI00249C8D77|nr:hypothetical protein [Salinicola endophyticus]
MRNNIASARATLAELHQVMAERNNPAHGTLSALSDRYVKSDQYQRLSAKTKQHYDYGRATIEGFPTKAGRLGQLDPSRFSPGLIQRVIDAIAQDGKPAKANAALSYLRILFRWGMNRDYCATNPASGVEPAKTLNRRPIPERTTLARLTAFCQQRGAIRPTAAGSVAAYLWPLIEITYLCRLRAIETITLTDANALESGLLTNRRKGSRDNIVAWTPRLRAAWDAATAYRASVWEKRGRATPLLPASRPLFVSRSGDALNRHTLNSAWARMTDRALADGIITEEERFGLHALKRRGITDTQGNRHDRQEASGHRSRQVFDLYDFSMPIVRPSQD